MTICQTLHLNVENNPKGVWRMICNNALSVQMAYLRIMFPGIIGRMLMPNSRSLCNLRAKILIFWGLSVMEWTKYRRDVI